MASRAERTARIFAALEEDPGLLASELAERVDLPARHVVPLLWWLQDHGRVLNEGRRWYPAPDG